MTGSSYAVARAVFDLFDAGAWVTTRPAARCHRKGDGRVLRQAQEPAIQSLIIQHRPEHSKINFCLSIRAAVNQLISQEYGLEHRGRIEGAAIQRDDKTAPIVTDVHRRSDAPEGKAPVAMAVGGACHKLSMIVTVMLRSKARLCAAATKHMAMLGQNPRRVIGFFQDKRTRDAA